MFNISLHVKNLTLTSLDEDLSEIIACFTTLKKNRLHADIIFGTSKRNHLSYYCIIVKFLVKTEMWKASRPTLNSPRQLCLST